MERPLKLLYNKPLMTQPFFSVIIPSFNRRDFLKKAVDSVFAQTYSDFELIVVDDGSDDGTEEIIRSYHDPRVFYLKQQNLGVSSARNNGIARSRGDFLAFLDSDDMWRAEKLEHVAEHIVSSPGISVFHTNETWFRDGRILTQKDKYKRPSGRVYRMTLPLCCIGMSTSVIKKNVFGSIGVFDETFEACEDYDFWLRAANKYEVKLIPEELTIKNGGRPDQLSNKVWGLDRFRIRALEKMLASGELNKGDRIATLAELEKKCFIFAEGSLKRGKASEAQSFRLIPDKYR